MKKGVKFLITRCTNSQWIGKAGNETNKVKDRSKRPAMWSAKRPAMGPAKRPAGRPTNRPANRPAKRPARRPAKRPATATRPKALEMKTLKPELLEFYRLGFGIIVHSAVVKTVWDVAPAVQSFAFKTACQDGLTKSSFSKLK